MEVLLGKLEVCGYSIRRDPDAFATFARLRADYAGRIAALAAELG